MRVWTIILASVAVAMTTGAIYLAAAVGRFGGIRKLSRGKNWIRRLISFFTIFICGLLLYFMIGLVSSIIVLLHVVAFFLIMGIVTRIVKRIRKKEFKYYFQGWSAIAVSVVYLGVAFFLCNNVWQTDYQLTTDKQVGQLKIAVFADSHVGTTFGGEGFSAHMETIMEQNPDIVLIPGDYVDDDTSREDMVESCAALGRMHPKYGVWFAYGNHDRGYYRSAHSGFTAEELEQELLKNGVHVMKDDVETVDNICIVGRKDSSTERDRKELSELLEGVDDDKYIIVMDHEPTDYEKESQTKADLVVSGHTHGGQLFPVTYFGVWFGINDAIYGYERLDDTDFIVTSGISDWAIKFKTGTKSEYAMINVN